MVKSKDVGTEVSRAIREAEAPRRQSEVGVDEGRRRFLKYAAGLTFVAGSGLGLYGLRQHLLSTDCSLPFDSRKEDCFLDKDPTSIQSPNIVWVVLDSCRAGHITKELAPNICALADQGIRFENFFANAGYTRASSISYLSGLTPKFGKDNDPARDSGFRYTLPIGVPPSFNRFQDDQGNSYPFEMIPPNLVSLPSILRSSRKYITININQNQMVGDWMGWGQKHWDYLVGLELISPHIGADTLFERAMKEIKSTRARGQKNPFFLYLHTADVHSPYDRRNLSDEELAFQQEFMSTTDPKKWESGGEEFRVRNLPRMREYYNHGVRFSDSQVGSLVRKIRELEKKRDTIFFIFSDHGEMFYEGEKDPLFSETRRRLDIGHTGYLPPEIVHVPLVVFGGWVKKGVVDYRLRQGIDLVPTVLNITEDSTPSSLPGKNLFFEGGHENVFSYSPFETAKITLEGSTPREVLYPL